MKTLLSLLGVLKTEQYRQFLSATHCQLCQYAPTIDSWPSASAIVHMKSMPGGSSVWLAMALRSTSLATSQRADEAEAEQGGSSVVLPA